MLTKQYFKISGINCKSCKYLIESKIDVLAGVKDIKVNYQNGKTYVEYEKDNINLEEILLQIEKLGYKTSIEKSNIKKSKNNENEDEEEIGEVENRSLNEDHRDEKIKINHQRNNWQSFAWGLGIMAIIALILIYFIWQRNSNFSLFERLNEGNLSYGLILLIGILASFHCIGMCGGFVVAYSAHNLSQDKGKQTKSSHQHFAYNLGRLISYTIIGGILGGIGSFFAINPNFSGGLLIVAAILMLIMGLNFLTNRKIFKFLSLKMPGFAARFLYQQQHSKKPKGPFIIGLLNGLMPCGPLQAMQLYALSTGSFSRGALSMLVYALGTVPLMLGFGTFISAISKNAIQKIMRVSGVVILLLALFTLNRGLTNFGLGIKTLVAKDKVSQQEFVINNGIQEFQTVEMNLTYQGYEPNVLFVKNGIPVRWVINVKQMTGCTDEILMPDYKIDKLLKPGENIIEFTPTKAGEIKFSCGMRMVWGRFIVTENEVSKSQKEFYVDKTAVSIGAGCQMGGGGGCGCGMIKRR